MTNGIGSIEQEQVSWNLSAILIMSIGEMLSRGNRYYIMGRIQEQFFCFKSIKMQIIQSLTKNERALLSDMETKIWNKKVQSKGNKNTLAYHNFVYFVEGYQNLVMDLLDQYGYLISKKKDSKHII